MATGKSGHFDIKLDKHPDVDRRLLVFVNGAEQYGQGNVSAIAFTADYLMKGVLTVNYNGGTAPFDERPRHEIPRRQRPPQFSQGVQQINKDNQVYVSEAMHHFHLFVLKMQMHQLEVAKRREKLTLIVNPNYLPALKPYFSDQGSVKLDLDGDAVSRKFVQLGAKVPRQLPEKEFQRGIFLYDLYSIAVGSLKKYNAALYPERAELPVTPHEGMVRIDLVSKLVQPLLKHHGM